MADKEEDLRRAEELYRAAAEGGLRDAMDSPGYLLQKRGALDEAMDWYLRAAEVGSSYATEALPSLREQIKADGMLESLAFDTFGRDRQPDSKGRREWRSTDCGQLVERYFDLPTDYGSWDVRTQTMEVLGFVGSPTFRREDLPDALQNYLPTELPEQISLLDVALFKVGAAKCVEMTSRHRNHDEVHYAASILVLFAVNRPGVSGGSLVWFLMPQPAEI